MTTAVQTTNNVATNSPVIEIQRRSDNSVRPVGTATAFANDNLKHLINRRLRWSSSEQFVRQALHMLVAGANSAALGNSSLTAHIDSVVDVVRDAANRRRSFCLVEVKLVGAIAALIEAAERCR